MATYIKPLQGYIADVPRVHFKRCDGTRFYFDEVTQCSFTPNVQYQDVNAGWSIYPVAQIPGQGTLEAQLTIGNFDSSIFAMANGGQYVDGDNSANKIYELFTEYVTITKANATASLTKHPVAADNVYINGGFTKMTGSTPTTGKFIVTIGEGTTATTVALYAGDFFAEGDADTATTTVMITYDVATTNAKNIKIDNRGSAVGELVMTWPIYNNGADCTDAGIIAYYYAHIYRCRVTGIPGMDSSYKQAATWQVTFSAMDAKRGDDKIYEEGFYAA